MATAETYTDTTKDRIKLPFSFDVDRMVQEVQAMNLRDFIYYSVWPLTVPQRKVDIDSDIDYADGSWADWHDTEALKGSSYLTEIVDFFRQNCQVTLVRLLRLEPGATIKEHTDPTLGLHIPNSVIRLTIPILINDRVDFFLNRSVVPMKPGECWYLRLTDPHMIINAGTTVRVNMSIDMVPNDWVRSMIRNSP